MKTLVLILSAAAIIFLTTCDEESPTNASFSNGLRTIKLYNLNTNSVSKIQDVKNVVYDCIYPDSTYFTFATYYRDLSELLIRNPNLYYNYYRYYFGPAPINAIKVYPEQNIIFLSNSEDVYSVNSYGEVVSNLTLNDLGPCANPVFIPDRKLLMYGSYSNFDNVGRIISQNLETSEIDTLAGEEINWLYPIFTTQDESHLIYTQYDLEHYSIRSINLFDLQDIKVLIPSISNPIIGKNRSTNDKIAVTSGGTVYVLDLNSAEFLTLEIGGQFADISNDGEKIVFTTLYDLFLINSDGTNPKKIFSQLPEKKYLFLPSFSSNDEQIVFVESEYPFAYFDYQLK